MSHPFLVASGITFGLCIAVCASANLVGQEPPPEPTAQQLQAVRDAFLKVGVEYVYPKSAGNPWKVHLFRTKWGFEDAELARLPRVPFAFGLEIYGNVTDDGMKLLKNLGNLQYLHVGSAKLTDRGLMELKDLTELRALEVPGYRVTDAGLTVLKSFPHLRQLNIRQSKLTDQGLKLIAALPELRKLDIQVTSVTDAGLKELKALRNLEELVLNNTRVTDAGLKELGEIESLQDLSLGFLPITDVGLKRLHDLKKLRRVFLMGTKVTKAGVSDLQKSLPACTIAMQVGRPATKTSRPKGKVVVPYDDDY